MIHTQQWNCTAVTVELEAHTAHSVSTQSPSPPVEHSSTRTTVTANRETVGPLAPAWVWEIGEVPDEELKKTEDMEESTNQNKQPFLGTSTPQNLLKTLTHSS